jgi:hypothetical protein
VALLGKLVRPGLLSTLPCTSGIAIKVHPLYLFFVDLDITTLEAQILAMGWKSPWPWLQFWL